MVNIFDIYYADLSPVVGSEQGGIRPVVVVQNDTGNLNAPTVIVIPITTKIKNLSQPTHCLIHKSKKNGLKADSMALGEQVKSIDKSRLMERIGRIDNENEQNNVIGVYIANVTGRKKAQNFVWERVVGVLFKLVKEGNVLNATCR